MRTSERERPGRYFLDDDVRHPQSVDERPIVEGTFRYLIDGRILKNDFLYGDGVESVGSDVRHRAIYYFYLFGRRSERTSSYVFQDHPVQCDL